MKTKKAFTLIEVIIVMGIVSIILGFTIINLFSSEHQNSLNTTIDTFVADLRSEQLKAMLGDTDGTGVNGAYGVYLGTGNSPAYTLFQGTSYSSSTDKFTINLSNNIVIAATTFPNSQIVFNQGSGEVANYTPGSNTITIENPLNNTQKTLTINQYGVIISLN